MDLPVSTQQVLDVLFCLSPGQLSSLLPLPVAALYASVITPPPREERSRDILTKSACALLHVFAANLPLFQAYFKGSGVHSQLVTPEKFISNHTVKKLGF